MPEARYVGKRHRDDPRRQKPQFSNLSRNKNTQDIDIRNIRNIFLSIVIDCIYFPVLQILRSIGPLIFGPVVTSATSTDLHFSIYSSLSYSCIQWSDSVTIGAPVAWSSGYRDTRVHTTLRSGERGEKGGMDHGASHTNSVTPS